MSSTERGLGTQILNLIQIKLKNTTLTRPNLTISHVNAHSVNNKVGTLQSIITERNLDICAVMETWLKLEDDDLTIKQIPPDGYNIISYPRPNGCMGGGVALIFKDNLWIVDDNTNRNTDSMEIHRFILHAKALSINLYVLYRPPTTSVLSFCTDLADVLKYNITTDMGNPIIIGDFNIHMDQLENPDTRTFNDFLDSMNLHNKVMFPTHTSLHTLDLLLEDLSNPVIETVSKGDLFSDHHFIHTSTVLEKDELTSKLVLYQKIKKINYDAFGQDIDNKLHPEHLNALDEKVDHYNSTLGSILDDHAPEKSKHIKRRVKLSWFNDKIRREIQLRHKKEGTWTKDPTEYNLQAFYYQRRYVANMIKLAQREYYINEIRENRNNFKAVFKITNKLLFRNKQLPLPPTPLLQDLANEFNEFFIDKINKIMVTLKQEEPDKRHIESAPLTSVNMSSFTPTTMPEMVKLIHKTTIKSCELDPLPARLLKVNIKLIAPAITDIVNTSLTMGKVTTNLKQAVLQPLLKKSNLELVLKNYRPVSNLSFISKMLEHVVCEQLGDHVSKTGNLEVLQSAYKAGHSTETALLKVKTDILSAINNNEVVCLVLLDLSVAFDMISHQILLNRLKYHFGVDGTVLNWLESYLTGRCQKVALEGEDGIKAPSNNMNLTSGVPQGSILGPILFTLYVSPIGDICRKHQITFHNYAHDTQNYLGFKPQKDTTANQDTCLSTLENCIRDIRSWMKSNLLKLNDDKTEFLVLGTRKNLETAGNFSLKIGNDIIQQWECIRNLGIFGTKNLKVLLISTNSPAVCTTPSEILPGSDT